MQRLFLTPSEIADEAIKSGYKKANLTITKQLTLGILAGAFIAFGAQGANMAVHAINNPGLAKLIAGLIFPAGLIMVVIAGAELFTGNSLMIMALADRQITFLQLLRSWVVVYVGNLIGSVLIAYFVAKSGQFDFNGGQLGNFTINTALAKINLSFMQAFIRGILCNWLVCLAVWMSYGSDDLTGKVLVIFFPILLFVASGFEHSIANMYYIPAGIFADTQNIISWSAMFTKNLIPVTLGNIVGGAFFVGIIYKFAYNS
ncbi:MAG: formate/nitrite transporter family protein [Synergistaceae bacterium]|nr:formate/nitrite transporter family protein [Synergistaceae bacterium]